MCPTLLPSRSLKTSPTARRVLVLRGGGKAARVRPSIGFHLGDALPPGYYVLRGVHVVRFAADGTRTVVIDRGGEENLCATLA